MNEDEENDDDAIIIFLLKFFSLFSWYPKAVYVISENHCVFIEGIKWNNWKDYDNQHWNSITMQNLSPA